MRHRKSTVKLGRTSSHRKAMFRNMVTSLFKYDRISTTNAKAKELRRWADHIVTLAKRGDLHARRQALAIMREKKVVHQLFAEAEERFGKISGGYTRIVKTGHRPGDAAPMCIIELVSGDVEKKRRKAPPKPKVEPVKPEVTTGVAAEKAVQPVAVAQPDDDADVSRDETKPTEGDSQGKSEEKQSD